ncbi:MAG: PaaI family thioesterase [Vulcanimicrobiaceae bacterium]
MSEPQSAPASEAPLDDGYCIACGPRSEIGLGMRFVEAPDGTVESRLEIPARFQGWQGVVHGGIVAVLLDEAMAYAAGARGALGVTAELRTRFRKPVPVGRPLVVRGSVAWERRGVFGVAASVAAEDGTILAEGEGRFVTRGRIAPGARFAQLEPADGDGRT